MTDSQGGDEPDCPSDQRSSLTRPWQAGRDDGTDHNGTFSRPPTDLRGSPFCMRLRWRRGGTSRAMMRRSYPQPMATPIPLYRRSLPGGVANTAETKSKSDTMSRACGNTQVRLIHVVLIISNIQITGRSVFYADVKADSGTCLYRSG